jgi:hypothetical protein
VAEERREPAPDDFDILQNQPPKFNLAFKLADIIRCGGRHRATANRILKATKRRTNEIHFDTHATNFYNNALTYNLIRLF